MSHLTNKRILLGVTGGIAAYKSAEIIRRLQDLGAEVRVVMTAAATEFITPLTLQALSGNPVHRELLDPEAEAGMGHIELARWADLILIAPATADFIAGLVQGRGDNLLYALCLATPAQIAIAPAMNQGMWRNPATTANIDTLRQRNLHIFGPAEGSQACGDIGPGRMLEPTRLAELVAGCFCRGALSGKKVVITAGPTREAIDPVRYISNHSSGKMGYAIAEAAVEAGAAVTLISGPVNLAAPDHCQLKAVTSAEQMYQSAMNAAQSADIFIASAAVADYRPATVATQKIKKQQAQMEIVLERNRDIVSEVSAAYPQLFIVGFAAETQDVESYARDKLTRKGLNAIVANDVSRTDIGFNSDDNEALWITTGACQPFGKRSKTQLARDIIGQIAKELTHHEC